jgi:hypothetical protein
LTSTVSQVAGTPSGDASAAPTWIASARQIARGERDAPRDWTVLRGERPPVLDADGLRALLAPLVAALAWAGAIFRELVAGSPIDPLALLMRLVALAMTVRAVLLGRAIVERLALWASSRGSILILAPDGLYARVPEGEVALERSEIVGITERGTWQRRSAGRRFSPVYVIATSPLRCHLVLPPIFDATPGVLAERLLRWRALRTPESPAFPDPAPLASKVYEDAARGVREPGTTVIHHGHDFLRRGPWATVLLAIAMLDGLARAGESERAMILAETSGLAILALVATALVITPLAWVWYQRRSIAPQLGMAMVLTPAELLIRTRGGVLRVHWPRLQRLSIDARGRLSMLIGWEIRRALIIERKDGLPVRYDEAFLGVPAEVALELCDAYARGAVLPEPPPLGRDQSVERAEPARDHRTDAARDRDREPGDARAEDDIPDQT